jgi:hypothetical protein
MRNEPAGDREVYALEDLPAELAEAIARAKMDPEHDHLDSLLDPTG